MIPCSMEIWLASGVGHGTDDTEGVHAGVAGVELGDLGLVGGAASGGAAEDGGHTVTRMVLSEIALLDCLFGGYEGELGGALGGGDGAGGEVGGGVEVAWTCGPSG